MPLPVGQTCTPVSLAVWLWAQHSASLSCYGLPCLGTGRKTSTLPQGLEKTIEPLTQCGETSPYLFSSSQQDLAGRQGAGRPWGVSFSP